MILLSKEPQHYLATLGHLLDFLALLSLKSASVQHMITKPDYMAGYLTRSKITYFGK